MKNLIREYIRFLLEKEVLGEPDQSEERDEGQEEQSVVAAVAGATTPLGTTATYPAGVKKKRKKKSTGPKTKKDKK